MKIGILTRRYGYNLGSTLQAFAMAKMIHALGHEVEGLDYDESSAHWRWKIRPAIEHMLYKIPFVLSSAKRSNLDHRHVQEILFQKFEEKYIPLTDFRICSSKGLRKVSKNYDKIILGSDQIWSPFLFDPNFLGSFLNNQDKYKAIPYA
ncbi:MAG: hypothetical protein K2N79_03440, partial [Muribaculaceae bacterium]|nr:hypothetical protein [Muribaculaceae bacterium]